VPADCPVGILPRDMSTASTKARVVVEPLELRVPVEAAVVAFGQRRLAAILESSRPGGAFGRYSVFAADPVAVIDVQGRPSPCPWESLADEMRSRGPSTGQPCDLALACGWIGFVAYEAGLGGERVEPHAHCDGLPRWGRFGLYDRAAVFDHARGQWLAVALEWPGRGAVGKRLADVRARLSEAARRDLDDPPVPFTTTPVPNMSLALYLRRVARAKDYIANGDVYEINLTQRITARTTAAPLELYRRLRRTSPAWYGAFLQDDEAAILSASPELFLELRDGRVITRPIKGTRARIGDSQIDAASRMDLERSEKDRAELVMIVDLLRNDLGRVCSYGSVRVAEASTIEAHAGVFHQVATIEGRLAAGKGWPDLLRAAFPGGSVTGAPKVRAMQIIRELEPTPRGVYCGAIGWIGLNGNATFNIAIRTMVQQADQVHMYAGGAIVADSDPQAEYDEIMAKLTGMTAALNCDAPAMRTETEAMMTPA